MELQKLKLIIVQEYLNDVKGKAFWISTFLLPVIMIVFGGVIGYLASESDSLNSVATTLGGTDNAEDWSAAQALAMFLGVFLTLFIMSYGAIIFNKVKIEKSNRIMEVLATCVTGRTMMLAKIISVGLTGLTQMLAWALLIGVGLTLLVTLAGVDIPLSFLWSGIFIRAVVWSLGYFIGGYVFFGSLFAAVGAMSDRNNENQEYMSVLTFILLGSFYIGMYAVDHGSSTFAIICSFIPFTASTCGAVGAISGSVPVWLSLLSLLSLLFFAYLAVSFAGKLYTSSLLLTGKKLSPADIITFMKTK